MPYLDLTQTLHAAMPVYPGDSSVTLEQTAFLEREGYRDFLLKTGMHVGTHIDAPAHMLKDGKKLAEFEVDRFIGRGVLVDARNKPQIGPDLLQGKKIEKGDVVILLTGWSANFYAPNYYHDYPEIAVDFAQQLCDRGVTMVGIDSPSADREPFPVHKLFFKHEILIIENLINAEKLLDVGHFEVMAFPPKFESDAAPVRVVAKII